jgi:hypothetical protein
MNIPIPADSPFRGMDRIFLIAIIKKCVDWTNRLREAGYLRREEWLREIQRVEEECELQREHYISLKPCATETLNYVAREFVKIIEDYDGNNGRHLVTAADRTIHKLACRSMLESALIPGITVWDVSIAKSEFLKELMILSFPSLPDLKCLRIAEEAFHGCSWLLVNSIWMLTHLQEFYFPFGCFNQVLAELGKHCSKLKRLSVMFSEEVNDGSVIHLKKLKNLVFLNVGGTSITPRGYGEILSGLSKVQNVMWTSYVDDVLMSITKEEIHSVKHLFGTVRNVLILALKYPFITHLSLYRVKDDLSNLKELTTITDLALADCDSDSVCLVNILQSLGSRLRHLELKNVNNVSVRDVINCCTHLETFAIKSCNFTCPEGLNFEPQLQHFQNLAVLELTANQWYEDFHSYLKCYVNLKELIARNTPQLDDTAVVSVLRSKGFQELRIFSAHGCGALSMLSAFLLMEYCDNLIQLRGVGTWTHVNVKEDMGSLMRIARYTKNRVKIRL